MEATVEAHDAEGIRRQLFRILSTAAMKNAPVIRRFLEFVVQEKLAGKDDAIKEYTIGVRVLGRPVDFNPQLDAIVRIHAGRVRRMLHDYYAGEGRNDQMVINIPKGTYVPVFEVRNQTTFAANSELRQLVSASTEKQSRKPVVAIFPFLNLSANHQMGYFVEAIGEQLCSELAHFSRLSILSYYSTWKYAQERTDYRELGTVLGADYILSGSVRLSEQVLRLNVSLTMSSTAVVVWSKSFDHSFNMNALHEVEDEIIRQIIISVTNDHLTTVYETPMPLPSIRTDNRSVYEAIGLYYQYQRLYTFSLLTEARGALQKALVLEPDNALVIAMLAKLCVDQFALDDSAPFSLLEEGMHLALRSLMLDPYCIQAYQAKAWGHILRGEQTDAYTAIRQCLALNHRVSLITGNLGFGLVCLGWFDEGFAMLNEASELSPRLPWCSKLGFALYYYYHAKDFLRMKEWLEKIEEPKIQLVDVLLQVSKWKLAGAVALRTPATAILNGAMRLFQLIVRDENLGASLNNDFSMLGLYSSPHNWEIASGPDSEKATR